MSEAQPAVPLQDEAMLNIREAIEVYLESLQAHNEPVLGEQLVELL